MNNANWDDLRIFLTAARSGSLSAASRELGSNQPTVGRHIDMLEQTLGMRLFQRHPRGLTLTDEGKRILEIAEEMDRAAATLARQPHGGYQTISGTVHIAAPEGLAVCVLAPALDEFTRSHPDLNLILDPSSASADLTRGEADIAVRLYRPDTQDLVVRRIRDMEFGLYASTEYLHRHGTPSSATALQEHRFIGYGNGLRDHPENRWLEALIGPARIALRSDNTLTRLTATRTGMGIAVLPQLLITDAALERVLPEIAPQARTIWLAIHRDLQHVARNRLVLEFLADTLATA